MSERSGLSSRVQGTDIDTGIRDTVLQQIQALAQRHHIHQVILFGSRARGDFQERSDIDLAASGGDVISFAFDVDEETDTLLQYDVVNLDDKIQPELRTSIQREGIVLYEDDNR